MSKGVKIDDGNHKGLLVGVVGSLTFGLICGGVLIWLADEG